MKGFFRSTFLFLVFASGVAAGGTGVHLWRGGPAASPAADDLPPRRLEATIFLPVVDNNGRPLDAPWQAALEAHCRARLAAFKVPRYWRLVESFPMTVTGKIQKYRLREMAVELLGRQEVAAEKTA